MTDANQTIGIVQATVQGANVDFANSGFVTMMDVTTANGSTNSEFTLLVYNSISSFRGNTEAIFYGGLAAATAVSYQLVDG